MYFVLVRIVYVETGEIETTGVYDHIENIGELLTGGMKKIAYELIQLLSHQAPHSWGFL